MKTHSSRLFALSVMATYAVTLLPPWLRVLVGEKMQNDVNEVLEKAVLSAVAQTKGAVVGKHLIVSVSNQVLKRAADYALVLAPEFIGQATKGSADALKKMIMARMEDLLLPPSSFDVSKSAKVPEPETGKTDFGSMIPRARRQMKQTHEKAEALANRNRGSGVWLWVVTILAAVGVVGAVMLAAATMPLGFAPTKTMTER